MALHTSPSPFLPSFLPTQPTNKMVRTRPSVTLTLCTSCSKAVQMVAGREAGYEITGKEAILRSELYTGRVSTS